jgi:hypothetical protein
MSNASINLTIDLNSFRQSLTSAFAMYSKMIEEMGKQSPINAKEMEKELRKITDAAKEPIKIKAETGGARIELQELGKELEATKEKGESYWQMNRAGFASLSLIYNGVMSVFNDVTRIFGGMINQQIEAQKGMARVEAAVRSSGAAAGYTAEQLKSLAGGLEEAFGFDADDIMNQVTTPLLTFRAVSGEVFKDAQEQILNMSRALGIDLQSASMQVGKALQDPVEGLTALRRSGVSFTDQQQEMIQSMNAAGDAAGAQKLILAELNAEFGGQAAAYMETGAGKLEALKVAFDNLSESIGGLLLPVITTLGAVVKPIVEWISNMDNAFKVLIPTLLLATAAWYKYSVAQTATATISGALTGAIAAASAAVQGFLTAVGPVGWVMMGVTAAVTAWTVAKGQAKNKSDELAEAQKGLKDEIKGAQNEVSVEAEKFNILANRLLEIKGKTDQTAESKKEMKGVISSLNENYGEYLGNIDLETASYDRLAEALRQASAGLIQKKIAEVYGQKYNTQVQEVAELQIKLNELRPAAEAAQDKMNQLRASVDWDFMTSDKNAMGFNPATYFGKEDDWSGLERVVNQFGALSGRLQAAKNDLQSIGEAYRQAMLNVSDLEFKPGGEGTDNTGNSTATQAAAAAAEAEKREAERLMAELAKLRETETAQLQAEYEKRKAIILKYTEDNSEAEKTAIANLNAWKAEKEAEITARENAGMQEKFRAEVQYLSNLQEMGVSSYDQLKAKMEEYYAWAKENLSAEEAALVLKQQQESNLRWGEHQKEREEKERAHQRTLADIKREWNDRNKSEEEQDLNEQLVELERHFEDQKALMIQAGMSELEIEQWKADEKERITTESEEKIQKMKLSLASSSLNQMSGVLGKFGDAQNKESKRGFKTWKAMATAQAIVDMASAVLGAFKSQIAIPIIGPILAAAQAAAALAFGSKQISEIQKTEYEPPQAAEGGYLEGPSHREGGTIIEVEGGEYMIRKSRVSELGKNIFDFINNGPIAKVRELFAGMALPAIEFNAAYATDGGGSYSFAGGGSVPGNNIVSTLLSSLDDKMGQLLEKKIGFDIHIDPLDTNPVRVSEIADAGRQMRSEV